MIFNTRAANLARILDHFDAEELFESILMFFSRREFQGI
jgi:hypothetical protein